MLRKVSVTVSRISAALLLAVLLAVTASWGQMPSTEESSSPQFKVKIELGRMVQMRDGVKISADIYRPDAPGRFPVVLSQTPYDNLPWARSLGARWFVERGYAFAVVDIRGRYDSEGDWDPFDPKHKTDGYDMVEWLARQPWSSGKIGTAGPSFMGWTQWWTASEAPPSLTAIAPEVAPPDGTSNFPYQGGLMMSVAADWAGMMAGRTNQMVAEGAYGGFTQNRLTVNLHLPLIELPMIKGATDAPFYEKWLRNVLSTDDYWKNISYQGPEHYSKMTVPSLNITGWFDANYPGSPMNYAGMKRYGATPEARRPFLTIGPWTHYHYTRELEGFDYGAEAEFPMHSYLLRYFDHYLKGIDNGFDREAPVHVFVMGRNKWYAEQDWPLPETQWTTYYIHSHGHANSLKGDGALDLQAPTEEAPDAYTYDPMHPTIMDLGVRTGHIDGAVDTRIPDIGDDVLVYTTPPLTEDVEVTGPVKAVLYAATSAHDTAWMMRLVDVHPDGYSALLCDAIMRARFRDPQNAGAFNAARLSEVVPDRVYQYSLDFWRGTGNVFEKGHQIRIEISSSYFPFYLPILNTAADLEGFETHPVVARQKVYHTHQYPSHVVLPVIPRR